MSAIPIPNASQCFYFVTMVSNSDTIDAPPAGAERVAGRVRFTGRNTTFPFGRGACGRIFACAATGTGADTAALAGRLA